MKSRMMTAAVLAGPRQIVVKEVAVSEVVLEKSKSPYRPAASSPIPATARLKDIVQSSLPAVMHLRTESFCIVIGKMFHVKHIGV